MKKRNIGTLEGRITTVKKTHENVTRKEFTAAEKVAQRHQKKEVAS